MSEPANARPAVRCPRCGQPTRLAADNPWRPFCRDRCRLVDFGGWLGGERAIPGEQFPPDEDTGDTGPEGSLH